MAPRLAVLVLVTAAALPLAPARADDGSVVVQPSHALPGATVAVRVSAPCDATAVEVVLRYTSATDQPGREARAAATGGPRAWQAALPLPPDVWLAEGVSAEATCSGRAVPAGRAPLLVERFPGLEVHVAPPVAAPGDRVTVAVRGCRGAVVNATLFDSSDAPLWLGSDSRSTPGYQAPSAGRPGSFVVPAAARPGPATLGLACTQSIGPSARLLVLAGSGTAAPAVHAVRTAIAAGGSGPTRREHWPAAVLVLLACAGVVVTTLLRDEAPRQG